MKTLATNRRRLAPGRALSLIGLVSLLLGAAGTAEAMGSPIFDAPRTFDTGDIGSYPSLVGVGDLNMDGRPDLLVETKIATHQLKVMLAYPDGSFVPGASYSLTSDPKQLLCADFNRDGKPDLASLMPNAVVVRLGNGDGTLGTERSFAVVDNHGVMACADLDADGKLDLVATNYAGNIDGSVSVLLGNGDGTFRPRMEFATSRGPVSLAIADLNGDHRLDLAVVDQVANEISILLGIGDGTFAPKSDFATGYMPAYIAIGDVNSDQKPDLAITFPNIDPVDQRMTFPFKVYLGNGDGTFSIGGQFGEDVAEPFTMVDINHDGRMDLVAGRWTPFGSDAVLEFLGNGDGSFGGPNVIRSPIGYITAFADVNGDGLLDVIALDACDEGSPVTVPQGAVSVMLGNAEGSMKLPTAYAVGHRPGWPALSDLDGDGALDMIVTASTEGSVSVLSGHGDGTFAPRITYPLGDVTSPSRVVTGDVDGDGHTDVAVMCTGSSSITVLFGTGDGGLGSRTDIATGSAPVSLQAGDLDGDGRTDLAWTCGSTLSVVRGDASRSLGPTTSTILTGTVVLGGVLDVTRDGKPDAVYVTNYSLYEVIGVLPGNGDGTFGAAITTTIDYYAGKSIALGDFNRDGNPDVAYGVPIATSPWHDLPEYYGDVYLLFGNGNGTFGPARVTCRMGNGILPSFADLDGDGALDLVVGNIVGPCSPGFQLLSIVLGRGDGTLSGRIDYSPGGDLNPAFGDLNMDGTTDLVMTDGASDEVLVLLNQSPAPPTPTFLEQFEAAWRADAIELRWRFHDPAGPASVALQRASSAEGPWSAVAGECHDEGGTIVLVDRDIQSDRLYYYRLQAADADGRVTSFGPLAVSAGPVVRDFALEPVSPNPSQDRVRVAFALPRATHVRLRVLDVQGRQAATLEDRVLAAGRHEVVWEVAASGGRVVPGVYFARLEAEGRRWVRRFTLVK